MQSRRNLLKIAGISAFGVAAGKNTAWGAPTPKPAGRKYQMGLASYSTRTLDLEKTIQITKRLNLTAISLKQDFHLKMDLPPAQQKALAQTIRDAGLDFYACGVIYLKKAADVEKAFEFAKTVGIRLINGVPEHDLLDLTEQKCKEYDIALAIHNHGPTDKVYPTPQSAYELIKDRDKRMGLCIDAGHTARCGLDTAEEIEKYADRLLDVHFKDVTAAQSAGTTVEIGRGVINIPKMLSTLDKINYDKIASFEFEKDSSDPLPGMAESVGFVRGVLRVLEK